MTINRKRVTVGLAALGLVGLTGGGIAWAATDQGSPSTPASSAANHCAGYGMAYGEHSPMTAVAKYLGLSRAELVTQMRSGTTLAEIAKAQGKTIAGLKAAMLAAMRSNLSADLSLTVAQRTAMLAVMKSHLDAMITGNHTPGMDMDDMGGGVMSGSSGGMMGGSGTGMMGH